MLKERFKQEIVPKLKDRLNYQNPMQVPRLEKVVVNMGVSQVENPKVLPSVMDDLTQITGQKPIPTRTKKSISDFGVSQGDQIGCKVTLRRERAFAFLEKLFNLVLPGLRDFRGLSSDSFDGRGNYSLGIGEQLIFPEIGYDDIETVQGMDITIVTTADSDQEAYYLLKEMGLPFKD